MKNTEVSDLSISHPGELFDFSFCSDNSDYEKLLQEDQEFSEWIAQREEAALLFRMSHLDMDTDHPYEYEE